jgi:hypothetical protein
MNVKDSFRFLANFEEVLRRKTWKYFFDSQIATALSQPCGAKAIQNWVFSPQRPYVPVHLST